MKVHLDSKRKKRELGKHDNNCEWMKVPIPVKPELIRGGVAKVSQVIPRGGDGMEIVWFKRNLT